MVRETRHLWVGNLPDNIREDRIREHFKRYGRVQNVKLLGRMESASTSANGGTNSGVCATVAFMDIKSASKAHNVEHVLDERTLTTEYYEPAAIPSSAGAPSAGSSPAGSGYSGSSSSVNSAPAPVTTSRYHLSGEESAGNACAMAATAAAPATWRGTNDSATEYCRRGNTPAAYGRYQRNNSTAPYATPPSTVERTTPHHRWYASGERGGGGAAGGESTPSTPGGVAERRRRNSGSGSSRSESSSPEPSDTSRASTPAAPPPHTPHHTARRTPPTHPHQWPSTANGRPLAICVRNLPTRSTDSSLKDGLYHEYKKHGKVVWVKVVGQNADRYAVVRFKKPSDVDKALEVSQDKLFFGCKISVAPHQSCDDDAESAKPYETDIDEYHPKATRTLFIGNLEKDVTQQQLRDKFKHFGRIIEIDIKKGSGGGAGYAFCQYASISSVVEAIRAMDGEYVGSSRVKLGFGKPVATTCVWVDGLTEHTEKQVLGAVARCGAATSVCVDRAAGAALVHFEQAAAAGGAVRELRRVAAQLSAAEPDHPRLCVDYASRECQEAFYEQLEKHGGSSTLTGSDRISGDLTNRFLPTARHDNLRYDTTGTRTRAPSFSRGSSRTPRYTTHDLYDPADYAADRRYRVYEELGSSPQTDDANYEDRLQSVVVSPHRGHKHRRDSSTEDRKHSKERHRSAGGGSRRSRSGSRGDRMSVVAGGTRRRHRRRRDGSGSRGSRASRAGTPLRDEPDAPPTEPRRPRERPPLPMSLPLPKFAVQMLRAAPDTPRALPPAPASPPRPPSASSSSAGSAPHSPSLEERIRSLDEKYERWTGSRAHQDAPDRARLRHRLLELDINEVKPSEVVRSLLAKRSVFDEDSERLEGAARVPSPVGSPRTPPALRPLRYPFSATPQPHTPHTPHLDSDEHDRTSADPRLNRITLLDKLNKSTDVENELESRIRLRTPSIDKPFSLESADRRQSPPTDKERTEIERDLPRDDKKRRNSILFSNEDTKSYLSIDKTIGEKSMSDKQFENSILMELQEKCHSRDSFLSSEERVSSKCEDSIDESILSKSSDIRLHKLERTCHQEDGKNISTDSKQLVQKLDSTDVRGSEKFIFKCDMKTDTKSEQSIQDSLRPKLDNEGKLKETCTWTRKENERRKDKLAQNHQNKNMSSIDIQPSPHLSITNCIEQNPEINLETKICEKSNKEKYNLKLIDLSHQDNTEKENIENDKSGDKSDISNDLFPALDKKSADNEKQIDDNLKNDLSKLKAPKDKSEKEMEKEKSKVPKNKFDKNDKDRKLKEELNHKISFDKATKIKIEKDDERERDCEKPKHNEDKLLRHENHKKEKLEKDKKKDLSEAENVQGKSKKEERSKHDRSKKDNDIKRENKKDIDISKSRKSSRDESSRDICRKDSTDSSTSRTSHDSNKSKESESTEIKEEQKPKIKIEHIKLDSDKDLKLFDCKIDSKIKIKSEIKEEKDVPDQHIKPKLENNVDVTKCKEVPEKQRHYSVDSPSVDSKRKERLNSCSSLPSNIGHKRRMSSQEIVDYLCDEVKKSKNDGRCVERRDSKDSRSLDRPKSTKFNKGHFAKIIESKTKEDKKNQVKTPDDFISDTKDLDVKENFSMDKPLKTNSSEDSDEKSVRNMDISNEPLQNNLDFLATLELRSSEEDEKQKALRKEMKEKKRIQQLQQIQELQLQQGALQHAELINKMKDDKKQKNEDKKKEIAREKRMSTDRKSKDDKCEQNKRKNRRAQSTDSSDSDEPKKHSIFDIVDDGPTYISMYDKVKARSCKNMQKQEEEKRQEKIKAKFSQLKQSRAKREEKKRSSWDEDSESEHERRKSHKVSMGSSSDEDHIAHNKKRDKFHDYSLDFERSIPNELFCTQSNDEDYRNKLNRKNSRTRIISDSSDDEFSRINKNDSEYVTKIKKEMSLDSDSMQNSHESIIQLKEPGEDKIKKTSLLNLFGKSDSEENKQKLNIDVRNNYNSSFVKSFSNDLSSENESNPISRNSLEIRRKHKKKQKKYKFTFSDEETKIENCNDASVESDTKHKNAEKVRRHSNKKDKRKDKIRESFDVDEQRDEKLKFGKEKKSPLLSNESISETICCVKKEGKMEDIFGPLSDESDKDSSTIVVNKSDNNLLSYESEINAGCDKLSSIPNSDEPKIKDRDEFRRKKDKKRKEKKHFMKDDDNSLDVDAVGKAIEACLFADVSNPDENNLKSDAFTKCSDDLTDSSKLKDIKQEVGLVSNKYIDKLKRDSRDKKKKKKRNREDKRSRKNHHHFYDHDKVDRDEVNENVDLTHKTMLCDIPLPNDVQKTDERLDDNKLNLGSPSLPRITDSPLFVHQSGDLTTKNNVSGSPNCLTVDERIEAEYEATKSIEIDEIPMPPPIENIVQDISQVPLPKDPPIHPEKCQRKNSVSEYDAPLSSSHTNEDAVKSIQDLNKEQEKQQEKVCSEMQVSKIEKKVEEKPRAIISQEETADAVAALLGESFRGKTNIFPDCYEETQTDSTDQVEIENTVTESENIPEEDAEEMRQAVQNLNACEMEMKPETPVSDNDLLLIDTDTEETEETNQDAIERLPVNIIATNQSLNNNNTKISASQTVVCDQISNIISKPQALESTSSLDTTSLSKNIKENDRKSYSKNEIEQMTSTATPVITSWSLTTNKLIEPQVLNLPPIPNIENENKPTHITANIVQIKAPQNPNIQIANSLRPILNPNRVTAPYQVINQLIRPQVSTMQPPTIKIPEPHIIYQKPQGIVISPRMTNDPRLLSPKTSPQAEGMSSPRRTNMAILSTSSHNINTVGIAPPTTLQQRSPGQVTVVRMQQPPLSPIQTVHIQHGARAMVSPNRPNSVLVQTQGAPIHFNRLPVTPVLAPISKQLNANNIMQQTKSSSVNSPALIHQPKTVTSESRKTETIPENAKIILSPTRLPQNNATILAQNRLISMQNALHVSNINSNIHLSNKVMINSKCQLGDKRENTCLKPDQNHITPYLPTPIIHVASVSHSTASIIQSSSKPVMCNAQDTNTTNRGQSSNVIHAINSPRLLTTSPITNVIQLEASKGQTPVLSMATIRSPTVLTRSDLNNPTVVTTSSLANVVMTPLLLKTNTAPKATIRLHPRTEGDIVENHIAVKLQSNNNQHEIESKQLIKVEENKDKDLAHINTESITKCETDFEELLKDNTNEIKVTNDPDKKLEINVGKTITLINQDTQKKHNDISEDQNLDKSSSSDQKSVSLDFPKTEDVPPDVLNKNIENCDVKSNEDALLQQDEKENSPVKSSLSENKTSNNETDSSLPKNNLTDDSFTLKDSQNIDIDVKSPIENENWTAKDVNIESVIKKVDSLCNDKVEDKSDENVKKDSIEEINVQTTNQVDIDEKVAKIEICQEQENGDDPLLDKKCHVGKRGGRNVRGKKSEKNKEKIQTGKIAKSPRSTNSSKRGRGRVKLDKKIKNLINNTSSNIPGDVYDFHEDSGDETSTSPNKTECSRPRLILTIKSPLSGNLNATATSILSITPKDQVKVVEKSKEEKLETFASPSTNTRKSRRLQEKDIQRNSVDDIIDDVIKNSGLHCKSSKETPKKRPIRQTGPKTVEKSLGNDTRKSPRGSKRTRDRSLSDASIESNDENLKREDTVKESKIPKLAEPLVHNKVEQLEASVKPSATLNVSILPAVSCQPAPTPIMKPPKKMISEISAKLAGAFDTAVNVVSKSGGQSPSVPERTPQQLQAEVARELRGVEASGVGGGGECAEAARARRADGGGPVPVGTEATDARVQSPALPHRPPSAHPLHLPPDRATPVLVRGGDGEGVVGAGGAGGAARFRGAYPGPASLPRGAHHPPLAKPAGAPLPHHPPASRVTITSVPSISPQGQMSLGEAMYPHFSQHHYQMYQQHFRATQHENRATPTPFTRGALEAEGSEAPTPPLELRRPPSARVPRPAHSPSPADRHILYAVRCGRSPPPAHGTSRPAAALPPPAAPGPPHASQVPREADSLQMLLRRYPVMWQGLLALKNDSAAVQMHFVGGNPGVAADALSRNSDGGAASLLRIAQRMRLEPAQLDQVHRKMKLELEHCMLLALPCGRDHMDVLQQSTNLTAGFITYLQRKQAAGIVNVAPTPGHHQSMYTVHIFPSCEFANENLNRIAPDLMHRVANIAHLLIVIATAIG